MKPRKATKHRRLGLPRQNGSKASKKAYDKAYYRKVTCKGRNK